MIESAFVIWMKKHWASVLYGAVALALAGAAIYSVWNSGYRSAERVYKVQIAEHALQDSKDREAAQAAARKTERAHAQALAALAATHAKEQADAAVKTERTVADLRAGTLRLRRELAARPVDLPGTDTSGSTGTSGPGLRPEDAEFLVREADRADGVVRDLNACNAARQVDRSRP